MNYSQIFNKTPHAYRGQSPPYLSSHTCKIHFAAYPDSPTPVLRNRLPCHQRALPPGPPNTLLSVSVQFSRSVMSDFVTPWITAHQASLSIINSRSLIKLMSIKSMMPSSHLILCCPFLLLPPIPPSTRVFSKESTLCMRWPKYWSFSFSISPSNEHPGLISPLSQ